MRAVRAVVIGASGLIGSALMRALGRAATGTYRTRARPGLVQLDASDGDAVAALLQRTRPDVLFFPAAEPNVDWCEAHPDEARQLNITPLETTIAASGDVRVVGFSSDYVFDGAAGPYDEEDAPRPVSVYGRIKYELEQRLLERGHAVIRTTTVFGWEPAPAKNFVLRLIDSVRGGMTVAVPDDQLSTPTFADDLALAASRIAQARGIWHIAGPSVISRADLARVAADVFGLDPALIRAVPTRDLGQRAPRPLLGGLRCDRYRARYGEPCRAPRDALIRLRAQLAAGVS